MDSSKPHKFSKCYAVLWSKGLTNATKLQKISEDLRLKQSIHLTICG